MALFCNPSTGEAELGLLHIQWPKNQKQTMAKET